MYDIFIIGGGPAGLAAGIYAVRAGYHTAVLEKAFFGGQMTTTPEVENYPGFFDIDGFALAEKMAEHARAAGVVMLTGEAKTIELSEEKKTVACASGEKHQARALILTMGADRRKLGCPGEERLAGKGVSYCAACDGGFFQGKTAVVVGGGNSALEDAAYLARLCKKVYLVHRRKEFRGVRRLRQWVIDADNIELVKNAVPLEIFGEQRVEAIAVQDVETKETRRIETEAVFCAVGTVPHTDLVKGILELDADGYVCAGEDCKTGMPGVFVAGDMRKKPLYQIITAAADGAVAAMSAADYLG